MRYKLCAFISLGVAALSLRAASPASADDDWSAVVSLRTPTPLAPASPAELSDATKKSAIDLEIDRLGSLAHQAKLFYNSHPVDARVPDAKEIEIMAQLQALQLGAGDVQGAAMALAQGFRADAANPVRARIDVALAMNAAANRGASSVTSAVSLENTADSLRTEFGDIPEVSALYLSAMRSADAASAQRIAQKLQGTNAPAPIKTEATKVAARAALVGHKIDLTGRLAGIHAADLQGTGAVVVYLWNAGSGTSDLDILATLQSQVPDTTRFVLIGLQSAPGSAASAKSHGPKGAQFFEPKGLDSDTAGYLQAAELPYAYVLKPDGTLIGYGAVSQIVSLVANANQ
jgi:hypothetical protein